MSEIFCIARMGGVMCGIPANAPHWTTAATLHDRTPGHLCPLCAGTSLMPTTDSPTLIPCPDCEDGYVAICGNCGEETTTIAIAEYGRCWTCNDLADEARSENDATTT